MDKPTDRTRLRLAWVRKQLQQPALELVPASNDASFRSYWRGQYTDSHSVVVMDAPPDLEDIRPWLDVQRRLEDAGLHVPSVYASNVEQGFVIMEDLGHRTYLPALNESHVEDLYGEAMEALLNMQQHSHCDGLPPYNGNRLIEEMELMPRWFLQRHLGFEPACEDWDILEEAFRHLAQSALAQPQLFVHRDFHSRNLLITEQRSPGIIDFQDALQGPVTYDLVSLLKDCYVSWPRDRVLEWLETYYRKLRLAKLLPNDWNLSSLLRAFDHMGLQRHLKVLGIFCRLAYRDGKTSYLANLPRVFDYVLEASHQDSAFRDLAIILQRAVRNRDLSTRQSCATL